MKKILFMLLLLLIFTKISKSKDFESKCISPVVLFESPSKSEYGSGVIIQSKFIKENVYLNTALSAEHVFENKMYAVTLKNDDQFIERDNIYYSSVIYKNKDYDLAAVSFVTEKPMKTADIDFKTMPKLRDKVCIIGCGLGHPLRYAEGLVTAFGPNKKKYEYIQTSVYLVPGDSGCPLYYDEKIIAISSSIRIAERNLINEMSIFKPIKLFQDILKSDKYKFLLDEQELHPKLLPEWLWLMDSQIKID